MDMTTGHRMLPRGSRLPPTSRRDKPVEEEEIGLMGKRWAWDSCRCYIEPLETVITQASTPHLEILCLRLCIGVVKVRLPISQQGYSPIGGKPGVRSSGLTNVYLTMRSYYEYVVDTNP